MSNDLELDQARKLIEILGRTNPSIAIVESVKKLIIWRDNPLEIINGAIKELMFRFEVSSDKYHKALAFIDRIKAKQAPKKPPEPTAEKIARVRLQRNGLLENKQKITELMSIGIGMDKIAKMFKCSYFTVRKFVLENSIRQGASLSRHNLNIEKMLNSGIKYREIASTLNIPENDLKNHIECNFKKSNGVYFANQIIISEHLLNHKSEIQKMINSGVMYQEIATKLNVTKSSIAYFVNMQIKRKSVK